MLPTSHLQAHPGRGLTKSAHCSFGARGSIGGRHTVSSTPCFHLRRTLIGVHHRSLHAEVRKAQHARSLVCHVTATAVAEAPPKPTSRGADRSQSTEVVVIGSGIGGLSCAAMLASYGVKVVVCESHNIPGGAAHAWERDGYHFESGPSLYSGMDSRGRKGNPLAHVLQAVGEELDLIPYNSWNVILPEGQFVTPVGAGSFEPVLAKVGGPNALAEWARLQEVMKPLSAAATMLPPAALRADPGVALTAFARYAPQMLRSGLQASQLTGPFSKVLNSAVSDPFILNYMNLLTFLLSGLPADGTIAAEVAFMFNEWYKPGATLQFPRGGSQAMVAALVRGIEKFGGKVLTRAHVEQIIIEDGRATGVALHGGGVIRASKAVVTNATIWDTLPLLPPSEVPAKWAQEADATPVNRSFMHLHLGIEAKGLPPDLELHHIVVNSWEGGVDTEQNVVLVSIASIIDPALAPPGKHTVHAYLPATEPFHRWEGLRRGSPEYKALKKERAEVLWKGLERIIPDIRQRVEIEQVGTPLTHKHFLRRHMGSYGPGIRAGEGSFPGPFTPVKGLLACGDCSFPGIGLPAVAASGTIAANSLVPVWDHWKMMDAIGV